MAVPGEQSRSHLEENASEKQSFMSKVKDSLNLTKHLGFISDVDSPANQAALAAHREKEAQEGWTEDAPQAPLSERIMQGVTTVAGTATEVVTGVSGGVQPKFEESPEPAESHTEDVQRGETVEHPGLDMSSGGDKKAKGSDEHVAQDSKDHKHSWPHWSGHKGTEAKAEKKGTDANAEKEGHGFSKWALHAAHKLGDVVASKDLDDESSKKTKKKT